MDLKRILTDVQSKFNDNKYHRSLDNIQARSELTEEETESGEKVSYFHMSGKAVAFSTETVLLRYHDDWENMDVEVRESIDPKAFENCDVTDVLFDLNHDMSTQFPLARSRNKTLTLDIREDGVYFDAKVDSFYQQAKEVDHAIRTNLINECSFAFTTPSDGIEYTSTRQGNSLVVTRTIKNIDYLGDVSVVNRPAYGDGATNISSRNQLDLRSAKDLERYLDKVETEKLEAKRGSVIGSLSNLKF